MLGFADDIFYVTAGPSFQHMDQTMANILEGAQVDLPDELREPNGERWRGAMEWAVEHGCQWELPKFRSMGISRNRQDTIPMLTVGDAQIVNADCVKPLGIIIIGSYVSNIMGQL
jgi:hypothetical protein